jgi:hypothetical protein
VNIFIDMDEVVADFTGYANKILKRTSLVDDYATAEWGKLKQYPRLYRDLPVKEGGPELVDWIINYAFDKPNVFVAFLSAVPRRNDFCWAFQDKVHWANKHFPNIPVFFGPFSYDKYRHCKPGDILIGKITPKGESDPTPEEKLLRAIFGDKAGDVKDASLKADSSLRGVVINKKLFSRNIKDKKKRTEEKLKLEEIENRYKAQFDELRNTLLEKLNTLVNGKTSQGVNNDLEEEIIPKGAKFTLKLLQSVEDYVLFLYLLKKKAVESPYLNINRFNSFAPIR